jgi:hypothetical protein
VQPLTPAERAQRAWKLEPPPEDVPPSEGAGARATKGKAGAAKGGKVTHTALQEAVAKTAVLRALAGELAVEQTGPAERLPTALRTRQAAGGGDKEGGERGSKGESIVGKGAGKGKRPAEPVPTPKEVVEAGAKRKKKAATGEEQSAGIVRTQRVQVWAVGRPASKGNDLGDFEAEADDFEEVFSVETEGGDVCEAVQRLLPANIIASDAMDRLARRERWPPYDNEAEGAHFRTFVICLLDAAQRGVLTTLTRTERQVSTQQHGVDGQGGHVRLRGGSGALWGLVMRKLASRDLTAAIMDDLNQEGAEEGAPGDGAGPSHVAPREGGPSQEAAAHTQSGRPLGGPTFLLTPMVEDAVAYAVQGWQVGWNCPGLIERS